jgi:Zn-dependent M28 family amino/carboxypeptidase
MIGDTNLNIYYERNSSKSLMTDIWKTAAGLGYSKAFIPTDKYSMLDDHTPFLNAGIPAVDIIDFDYPYWHTTSDTANHVSSQSLMAVGATLWAWLQQ